jgi:hypothetical protein
MSQIQDKAFERENRIDDIRYITDEDGERITYRQAELIYNYCLARERKMSEQIEALEEEVKKGMKQALINEELRVTIQNLSESHKLILEDIEKPLKERLRGDLLHSTIYDHRKAIKQALAIIEQAKKG